MSGEVAPALSTAQTDDTFQFDQFQSEETKQRSYLKKHDPANKNEVRQLLRDYYSIDELIEFLQGKFKKITLQFPDSLVCDSSYVVQMLQEGLIPDENNSIDAGLDDGKKHGGHCATCTDCSCGKTEKERKTTKSQKIDKYEVWVLADTSYSPCCVDEVAAEHIGADVVVHFGDSCLTPVQKLPSVYVFGKPQLDINVLTSKFEEQYQDTEENILLMSDTSYSYILKPVYDELKIKYRNLAYAEAYNEEKSIKIINYDFEKQKQKEGIRFGNRLLTGLHSEDIDINDEDELNSLLQTYSLFHITLPEPSRLLFLTTKFSSMVVYDPKACTINNGPFSSLMRRYRYMHVARTAGTVGILVNTLSLDNTKKMVNIVAKWIKDADKKYYMFVVGKPNVAKLANFDAIDVWCILGCGQGGIIIDETSEYFKPIITPYELHLALSPEVSWTGKWVTGFKDIIKLAEDNDDDDDDDFVNSGDEGKMSDEDYAPEFSAVTGKYVSNSRPLRQINHLQIELNPDATKTDNNDDDGGDGKPVSGNQLVKKFSQTVAIKGTVSTSAIHLQSRQWTGLGSDFKDDENYDEDGATIEEGRSGVARGYDHNNKSHII
ncbi:2-(3-amino-3-carboxypropyl)histidine synthase [Saccharomycopsis crataegensis]|uniref:2-(3-amino-3-carboxypropyl)histidine synthase subunit 2 n=1 Tax=Saccharomycopsis crataegensis TaxID=43959 RepID=A0AAV5QNZ8_9ASCO|nr:2-(3-amino-3-carboxypropyl)histidine synthase [Saccharomycopsis crataegensis]